MPEKLKQMLRVSPAKKRLVRKWSSEDSRGLNDTERKFGQLYLCVIWCTGEGPVGRPPPPPRNLPGSPLPPPLCSSVLGAYTGAERDGEDSCRHCGKGQRCLPVSTPGTTDKITSRTRELRGRIDGNVALTKQCQMHHPACLLSLG